MQKPAHVMNASWNIAIAICLFRMPCEATRGIQYLLSAHKNTDERAERLSTHITLLLETCFNSTGHYVTVVGGSLTDVLATSVLHKLSVPALMLQVLTTPAFASKSMTRNLGKSDIVALLAPSMQDRFLHSTVSLLRTHACWSPVTSLLVVVTEPVTISAPSMEMLLHFIWEKYILQVAVLTPNASVFIYNPFSPTRKLRVVPIQWNTTVLCGDVFRDKLQNLHGYHMKVSMFNLPPRAVPYVDSDGATMYKGTDGDMIHTIVRHMNAMPAFASPPDGLLYGFKLKNGTVTGSRGDVLYGRAELAGNSDYWTIFSYPLEFAYPHSQNDYCIVVPKARQVPAYKNLLLPFSPGIWLLLSVYIIGAVVFWFIIDEFDMENQRPHRDIVGRVVLEVLRAFLTGAMRNKPTSRAKRLFLVAWACFSMVMTNTFQGSLTSYLAVPEYQPDINTLQQLHATGMPVFQYPGILQIEEMDPEDVLVRMADQFRDEYNYTRSTYKVARTGYGAAMMNRLNAGFMTHRPQYMRKGQPLLHVLEECALQCYDAYKLPLNSPFRPRIDTVTRRIIEAGLPRKWYRDMYHALAIRGMLVPNFASHKRLQPLSMVHLQTAFILLVCGLTLGSLSFVVERMWRSR